MNVATLLCLLLFFLHTVTARMRSSLPLPVSTLLDETLLDESCSCRLLILRPWTSTFSNLERTQPCLHITLCGRGTRSIARSATVMLGQVLEQHGPCHCVVEMGQSNGATMASLPIVASFMMKHRKQLTRISVLHARGLALNAVRIVSRLSHRMPIAHYKSLRHFEMAYPARDLQHRVSMLTARRSVQQTRPQASTARWSTWMASLLKLQTISTST